MSEEVFNKQEADGLCRRIIDRLGLRQEKIDRMAEMERAEHRVRLRPMAVILAIAACLVVAFLISPLWRSTLSPLDELGIEAPSTENYRASTPELTEITQLMEAQRYDEALAQAEKALSHSDVKLDELEFASAVSDDDGLLYEAETERVYNSELRWTYIYLLVRTNKTKEARRQLKLYLKHPQDCEHLDEAKALQKALK